MKLLRYGAPGAEKPGLLDKQGTIRDLSAVIPDISFSSGTADPLARLVDLDIETLPLVAGKPRLGPCIAGAGNFIAVGLNYIEHATETDSAIPTEPILFNKAASCISGPYDDVVLPAGSTKADWEVELAVVISQRTYQVTEAEALNQIAGYCICNDISEREYQLEHGGQWMKGKCCPTFGPLGPYLVTPDEVPNPQNLKLWLEVNGERLQSSSTKSMIFSVAYLISYISRFLILQPGDIITTGTPPGVGLGMKPQRYLRPGDVMHLAVEGLGEQTQTVR
jgi:2-keto-4-pentenoate hydratase/2-oxohepta-3-ene-1,7-dioic acid hydratase in catechol pathway